MKFLPSLHIYYIFSALCLGIGIDRKWTGVMPEIEPKPIWTGVMPEIEPKPINTGVMPEIEPKPDIDEIDYYNYMDYLDYLEYLDYIDFIEALGIDRKSKQNQRKYQNPLRSSSSNKVIDPSFIDANEGPEDQHQIDIDKNSKENQLNDNIPIKSKQNQPKYQNPIQLRSSSSNKVIDPSFIIDANEGTIEDQHSDALGDPKPENKKKIFLKN